jgi:hypothetical protein
LLLRLIFVNPELERSVENVGELFMLVLMTRHDAALLETHLGEHDALTR